MSSDVEYAHESTTTTKYNPCVVEYVTHFELFIVGTYELFAHNNAVLDEEMRRKLSRVNNRFGNLLLIKHNAIVDEFECIDGGVFDLKSMPDTEHDFRFAVSHSNGFLAVYSIAGTLKLACVQRFKTDSSLLTCLAVTRVHNRCALFAGDSDGFLTVIVGEDNSLHTGVTKSGETIWCLYCHLFNTHCMLFVGSDDCLWRAYHFADNSDEKLQLKYTNKDSNAGITCFSALNSEHNSLNLVIGSYDEFIRYYSIHFDSKSMTLNASLTHKISIAGAGIWRITVRPENCLLVAAMYCGAVIVDSNAKVHSINKSLSSNIEQQKELIYGVASDMELKEIIVASFYCKSLYYFIKNV